jgi:hypothetical protein
VNTLRRLAFSLLVGALLGTLGAVFVAPSVLEWFASPAIPNALSCVDAVSWALGRFRLIILSAAVGVGLGTLVLVEVLRPKRATPPSATPPGVSSPGTPPSRP